MSQRFTGKVAVVTGASKGIGAAIAKQLAAEGAAVVVNYASSRAGADRIVSEITKMGGRAVPVQADLSKPADVTRLFAEAKKAFDRLDVLVNNAGVYEFSPLENITPEHFHRMFDLNVLGLLLASRAAAEQFGERGDSIVNISSSVTRFAPPNAAVYTATKASVDVITITLAKELGHRKIRVNAVNPGMIETEGVQSAGLNDSDLRKQIEAGAPIPRIGRVEDIAPAVAFLASDEAGYITGETLHVAGGLR